MPTRSIVTRLMRALSALLCFGGLAAAAELRSESGTVKTRIASLQAEVARQLGPGAL